jgi:hypothetical protein
MADRAPVRGSALAVTAALMTSAPALGVSPQRHIVWLSLCSAHGAVRQLAPDGGGDPLRDQGSPACHAACLLERGPARKTRGLLNRLV